MERLAGIARQAAGLHFFGEHKHLLNDRVVKLHFFYPDYFSPCVIGASIIVFSYRVLRRGFLCNEAMFLLLLKAESHLINRCRAESETTPKSQKGTAHAGVESKPLDLQILEKHQQHEVE